MNREVRDTRPSMPRTTRVQDAILMALARHGTLTRAEIRAVLVCWEYGDCAIDSQMSKYARLAVIVQDGVPVGRGHTARWTLGPYAPRWAWLIRTAPQ